MYEHKHRPMVSRRHFVKRVVRHFGIALAVTAAALAAGMCGYHFLGELSWIDAFVNAAMILGGMGPVSELKKDSAKLFAGVYALFAGVVFIAVAGVTVAPFAHRLLHHFHFDDDKEPM